MITRRLTLLALTILLVLGGAAPGWALSRLEFDKLLRMMPPDGPAARYGNVAFRDRSRKKGLAPVIFSHWRHRARYTCQVCHLELDFSMPRGGSGVTRGGNLAGRGCGACHNGEIAFTVRYEEPRYCDRCHRDDPAALAAAFQEFAAKMPRTETGDTIDWGKALASGIINPQRSLSANDPPMQLPDVLRKPLILGGHSSRSTVIFSHSSHVVWLDCANCHPDIFNIKKKGTESFSMDKNLYGWFCGTCHMRVAFPMTDCNRCHPNMNNLH